MTKDEDMQRLKLRGQMGGGRFQTLSAADLPAALQRAREARLRLEKTQMSEQAS